METFLQTYTSLNHSNLHLLGSIYTDDVIFIDPVHSIKGLQQLTAYFEALYQNINSIEFSFSYQMREGDVGYVQWTMTYSHPRVQKGHLIELPGVSFLKFHDSGKVNYHRDQFDLGCMLYEHLPVLGRIISTVKRRMGS